ncbi:MAG: hypothetical protein V1827_00775 [Candidatus Micrarchaeota archaeon]
MRILASAVLLMLIFGCVSQPSMTYSVSPCDRESGGSDSFSMSVSEGMAVIHQKESYVCCANMTISMKPEGKTIRIYEENVGEMCRCICPFVADIGITGIAGYDRLEVYGIKFKEVQDYELMFNSSLPG